MFLVTFKNPNANTFDFIDNGVLPENTQLKDIDYYRKNDYIRNNFTNDEGKFDEKLFNQFYQQAAYNYNNISNERLMDNLGDIEYNPFDILRPIGSKTYDTSIKFSQDLNNPDRFLYSRDDLNSITENKLSMRELAQAGRVKNYTTGEWMDSVNTWNFFKKATGDTLVYAQWDDDGEHADPVSGLTVKHKKGDWKVDETGSYYLETLANREVYGKQVVALQDILTKDDSVWNRFDPFDSDGKEKSVGKIVTKTLVEIAPLLIPYKNINTIYGGLRAGIGLITTLPTFYKGLENILMGDNKTVFTDPVTSAEGWLSKFSQTSSSDKGAESMWTGEQMAEMVTGIFSQIYEQRAMASLSHYMVNTKRLKDARVSELQRKATKSALNSAKKYGIDPYEAINTAVNALPELQQAYAKQSKIAKALSLGYMALISTDDVYAEAIESGYDRRTAGFAALLTASGQYGIMMNNRMGHWFLDKTTGFSEETNRALTKKAIKPYLKEIEKIFKSGKPKEEMRKGLAGLTTKYKQGLNNLFTGDYVLGEAVFKNMVIEGIEEATEQAVEDASKGIIDVMSYLGLTKKKGSFNVLESYKTGEAFEQYLAQFVGGVLGGGLFELERTVISPFLSTGKIAITPEVQKGLYHFVANGQGQELKDAAAREVKKMVNSNLSYLEVDGSFKPAEVVSQSDLVLQKFNSMIDQISSVLGSENLLLTDEEVINRAIRNKIVMGRMDEMVKEMSGYEESNDVNMGLEALALHDYKQSFNIVADLKNQLLELNKDPEKNKKRIKEIESQMKPHIEKVNSILAGEEGMKYFNQFAVMLNPEIKDVYGSLDKDTYTRAKYGVDYNDISDSGLGITKAQIDKEWDEFLTGTDLYGKIELITNAYLEKEKLVNPVIADYVDNGYYEMEKQLQEILYDVNSTINLFNTSGSEETSNAAINNFIKLNQKLEELGVSKILPYDVYIKDSFEELYDQGLLKKTESDSEGNIIEVDFEDSELNAIVGDTGKSLRDLIKEQFNAFSKIYPLNPYALEIIINDFNNYIKQYNNNLQKQIDALELTNTQESLAQAENLKKGIVNYKFSNYENSKIAQDIIKGYNDKITTIKNNVGIADFEEFTVLKSNEDVFKRSFDELVADFSEGLGLKDFDLSTASVEQKIDFLKYLDRNDVLSITTAYFGESINDVLIDYFKYRSEDFENLEDAEKAELKEKVEKSIASDYDDKIIKQLTQTLESKRAILNNSDLVNANKEINNIDKTMKEDLEKSKPEIFKMRNVEFDVLLDVIENKKLYSAEILKRLRELYDEEFDQQIKKYNLNSLTEEDLVYLVTNADTLRQTTDAWLTSIVYLNEDSNLEDFKEILKLIEPTWTPEEVKINSIENNQEYWKFITDNINKDEGDELKQMINLLNNLWRDVAGLSDDGAINDISRNKIITKYNDFIKKPITAKSNPLYDFIRNFSLTLNTDPENKINKIIDIYETEENAYKASSSVSAYIAENVRSEDLQQAINTLKMIKVAINAMSTTEMFGEDFNGFIATRKNYAKQSGFTNDDVMSLKTISSDQAAIMSGQVEKMISHFSFMKNLALFNSRKISNEDNNTRVNMYNIQLSYMNDLIQHDELRKFVPTNFADIINEDISIEHKLAKLEDALYHHNKANPEKFVEALLKEMPSMDIRANVEITSNTGRAAIPHVFRVLYLTSSVIYTYADFYTSYKASLEGVVNKAPFYLQELASRITIARMRNPEVFNKIVEVGKKSFSDDGRYLSFVLGGAGTGKTTVVIAAMLDVIRQHNEDSKIWVSAPSVGQATKFQNDVINSVGSQKINFSSFTKDSLFKQFGEKVAELYNDIKNVQSGDIANYINDNPDGLIILDKKEGFRANLKLDGILESIDLESLPHLLTIDEATHFSTLELELLSKISEYSINNGKAMHVVLAGDNTQLGFRLLYNGKRYAFNLDFMDAIYTPRLTTQVRASNDQQRVNFDIINNLNKLASDIKNKTNIEFRDNNITKSVVTEANARIQDRFKNILTDLKYANKDDKFRGNYIVKSESDIVNLNSIKSEIDSAKAEGREITVGILTENGEIDQNIETLLSKSGLNSEAYSDNIIVKTLDNVQGDEFDFFIYNIDILSAEVDHSEFLKAFYTFTTRSKSGSIIIDIEDSLNDRLSIKNAKKSYSYYDLNPLTNDIITELKNTRIDQLENNLEGLESTNPFKWNELRSDDEVNLSGNQGDGKITNKPTFSKIDGDFVLSNIDSESYEGGVIELETELNKLTETLLGKKLGTDEFRNNFNYLMYSYYNNPGVVSIKSKRKLIVDNNNPNTDLNGLSNIENVKSIKNITEQWISLKHYLIKQLSSSQLKLDSRPYNDYIKHIFGQTNKEVDVSLHLTLSKYNEDINNPVFLNDNLYDSESTLKSGDSFINVSAKLKLNGKVHYITLATFGHPDVVRAAIGRAYENDSVKKNENILAFNTMLTALNKRLGELNNNKKIIDLATLNEEKGKNRIIPYSGMRLQQIKKEDKILTISYNDLLTKYPGLHVSKMDMSPNNKNDFIKLHKVYANSDSANSKEYEAILEKNFEKLKNKPYVIVSYDKNDVNPGVVQTPGSRTGRIVYLMTKFRGVGDYDRKGKRGERIKPSGNGEVGIAYEVAKALEIKANNAESKNSSDDIRLDTLMTRPDMNLLLKRLYGEKIKFGTENSGTEITALELLLKKFWVTVPNKIRRSKNLINYADKIISIYNSNDNVNERIKGVIGEISEELDDKYKGKYKSDHGKIVIEIMDVLNSDNFKNQEENKNIYLAHVLSSEQKEVSLIDLMSEFLLDKKTITHATNHVSKVLENLKKDSNDPNFYNTSVDRWWYDFQNIFAGDYIIDSVQRGLFYIGDKNSNNVSIKGLGLTVEDEFLMNELNQSEKRIVSGKGASIQSALKVVLDVAKSMQFSYNIPIESINQGKNIRATDDTSVTDIFDKIFITAEPQGPWLMLDSKELTSLYGASSPQTVVTNHEFKKGEQNIKIKHDDGEIDLKVNLKKAGSKSSFDMTNELLNTLSENKVNLGLVTLESSENTVNINLNKLHNYNNGKPITANTILTINGNEYIIDNIEYKSINIKVDKKGVITVPSKGDVVSNIHISKVNTDIKNPISINPNEMIWKNEGETSFKYVDGKTVKYKMDFKIEGTDEVINEFKPFKLNANGKMLLEDDSDFEITIGDTSYTGEYVPAIMIFNKDGLVIETESNHTIILKPKKINKDPDIINYRFGKLSSTSQLQPLYTIDNNSNIDILWDNITIEFEESVDVDGFKTIINENKQLFLDMLKVKEGGVYEHEGYKVDIIERNANLYKIKISKINNGIVTGDSLESNWETVSITKVGTGETYYPIKDLVNFFEKDSNFKPFVDLLKNKHYTEGNVRLDLINVLVAWSGSNLIIKEDGASVNVQLLKPILMQLTKTAQSPLKITGPNTQKAIEKALKQC